MSALEKSVSIRFQDFWIAGVEFPGLLIGCLCFLVIKVFLGALSSFFGVPQEVFINFIFHHKTIIGTPKKQGKTYYFYCMWVFCQFELVRMWYSEENLCFSLEEFWFKSHIGKPHEVSAMTKIDIFRIKLVVTNNGIIVLKKKPQKT